MDRYFRLLSFLLLISVSYPLIAEEPDQPLPSAAVDSLQALLRRSQPDTNRVNLLLILCEHYLNDFKHIYDRKTQIEQYLKRVETLTTALHYAEGRARHLHMQGRLLVITGNGPAARMPFEKSLLLCRQSGYTHLEAENWLYTMQRSRGTKLAIRRRISAFNGRGRFITRPTTGGKKRISLNSTRMCISGRENRPNR